MKQRSASISRWAPLAVLLAAGAMVFRSWQSLELMLGLLNPFALCG